MYEIEVLYNNGTHEIIHNVTEWGSIQNGLLLYITTSGMRPSILIPSDKIIRISRVGAPITRKETA